MKWPHRLSCRTKLCRLAQQGSGTAAEDLVKRYTRLVKTCARPYFLVGADEEDLLQEGMLGLMKAIREFDGRKGTPFARLPGYA